MIKMVKQKYETYGFRVYVYKGADCRLNRMQGTIGLLDDKGKMIEEVTFNHSDEIVTKMRKLLSKHKMKIGYYYKGKLVTMV